MDGLVLRIVIRLGVRTPGLSFAPNWPRSTVLALFSPVLPCLALLGLMVSNRVLVSYPGLVLVALLNRSILPVAYSAGLRLVAALPVFYWSGLIAPGVLLERP